MRRKMRGNEPQLTRGTNAAALTVGDCDVELVRLPGYGGAGMRMGCRRRDIRMPFQANTPYSTCRISPLLVSTSKASLSSRTHSYPAGGTSSANNQ